MYFDASKDGNKGERERTCAKTFTPVGLGRHAYLWNRRVGSCGQAMHSQTSYTA